MLAREEQDLRPAWLASEEQFRVLTSAAQKALAELYRLQPGAQCSMINECVK